MVFIQASVGLILYIYNIYKGKKFFSKEYWKFALLFSIPIVPHYLSETILQQADRIMINNIVGTSEAAIYSVAYTISMLMVYICNAINQSFIPYVYKALKSGETKSIRQITDCILLLVSAGCTAVIAVGPEIIKLFATEEYSAAAYIIPPVAASVLFMFIYNCFSMIEMYYEKNVRIMIISIVVAIINIVLNYIFINLYGFIAAGYTTLFCYILFALLHYLAFKRLYQNNKALRNIYNLKHMLLVGAYMVVTTIFMASIYDINIIRYFVVTIIIALLIIKRKQLVGFILQIRKR